MPTPKVRIVSNYTIAIDDVEYEVRLCPERGYDIEHRKLDDGRMVIGYLMQDEDCRNPLEDCDGMGEVHSFCRRHHRTKTRDDYSEHNPYHVPLSYFEHGSCIWGVAGSMEGMPDFRWDGTSFAGFWEADQECINSIKIKAIEKLGLKIETIQTACCAADPKRQKPWVLSLSFRGKELWRGSSWSKMATDGLRIAKKIGCVRKALSHEAFGMARGVCETYTSWCNGDCYGVVVVTCEADGSMIDSDECWGYIGHEYAEQTLKEQMEAVK